MKPLIEKRLRKLQCTKTWNMDQFPRLASMPFFKWKSFLQSQVSWTLNYDWVGMTWMCSHGTWCRSWFSTSLKFSHWNLKHETPPRFMLDEENLIRFIPTSSASSFSERKLIASTAVTEMENNFQEFSVLKNLLTHSNHPPSILSSGTSRKWS